MTDTELKNHDDRLTPTPSAIAVNIEAVGLTDTGYVREINEDQFLVANLHRALVIEGSSLAYPEQERIHGNFQGTLLVVADGMGGESSGDKASRMAMEAIVEYILNSMPWFYRLDRRHTADLMNVLVQGVQHAEAAIHRYRKEAAIPERMGTTLTIAYILWPHMYVVHAGDSRCYLLRQGELRQLTTDHTIAQLMVDQGRAEQLNDERYGHVLWNAVGADAAAPVKPQFEQFELEFGDRLMLCSDGLYGPVSNEKIRELLASPVSVEEICRSLIDEANFKGGDDNITAIVCQFLPGDEDNGVTIRRPRPTNIQTKPL